MYRTVRRGTLGPAIAFSRVGRGASLNVHASKSIITSLVGKRLSISDSEVHTLHRRCEGWVAGLILLLRSSVTARPTMTRLDVNAETPQALFDCFAAELFTRWRPAVRNFLMQTALLPSFTAQMAERLTRVRQSRVRLNDLVQQMRERLSSQLQRVLPSGSSRLMQARRHEDSARCLERSFELDPLVEETYCCLMQAQLALGRRADALSTHDRCRRTLAVVLGVRPSPDIEAVRRHIAAANP